jgi:TonB family protein
MRVWVTRCGALLLMACGASAPPPEPAEKAPEVGPQESPQVVPQVSVNEHMISGTRQIVPDDNTKREIYFDRKSRVVATFKLCVDRAGVPSAVTVMKSTGYPMYDARLMAAMESWRFQPFVVDGKVAAICTPYTFIYNQKNND